jgi:hypothetical protein
MPQTDSFFLLKIIKDINAVPAKLLFKNTCLYVNVYLRAVNSGLILAFSRMLFLTILVCRIPMEKAG